MQKHKDNLFLEKFSLLNSQEKCEDIKWSSSSSSDYENTSNNGKLCNNSKARSRKRKRKKKTQKNISNLDIKILESYGNHKRDSYREKSPILVPKSVTTPASPILSSTKFPPNKRCSSSPILSVTVKSFHQKSPILISKNASPKHSVKVRKKLAYNDKKTLSEQNSIENMGGLLGSNLKTPDTSNKNASEFDNNLIKIESTSLSTEISSADDKSLNSIKSNESGPLLKAKLKLMNNVKSFFDSHFSSENTSQNISDTPTPEECSKNETIDILSCRTQSGPTIQNLPKQDSTSTSNSDTSNYFQKNKKVKYKKGGLAYRLNMLLKKQNAQVSLWQHERFLAGTSNFVIPKGEHVVFFIKKIHFKYGCYLLDAVDVNNEKYFIFMNSLYVNNNLSSDSVLKLYEPYKTLEFEDKDFKIIINVCKFECFDLNNM